MDSRTSFFQQYTHYLIIGIISIIILFVFPMIGTEIGMAFVFPNTFTGWLIFIVTNICSALSNMLIFNSFIQQGKINIRNNPSYLAANELLRAHKIGKFSRPLSPQEWHAREYRHKGISLFLFSILGTIAFGQAILVFDLVKFISQALTLIFGLIFGLIEMKKTEEFWTVQYPEYAEYIVKEQSTQKEKALLQEAQAIFAKEEEERKQRELATRIAAEEEARKQREEVERAARIKKLQEMLAKEQQGEITNVPIE